MTALPSFDLSGQVALVTGASSGIGRHLAALLAAAGAKVALGARRAELLDEVAHEIEADGGSAAPVALDVTARTASLAPLPRPSARLGRYYWSTMPGLRSPSRCSSIPRPTGTTFSTPILRRLADGAGFRPSSRRARAAGSDRQHRFGLGVSDDRALAGLLHLQGRAHPFDACAGDGVGALQNPRHALAPGYLETDFNRDFLRSEAGKRLAARIPLRRVAQPDDLDGAMLLLASPAGAYITGAVIAVDGGHGVAPI